MLIQNHYFCTLLVTFSLTAFGAGKDQGTITLSDALARALRRSPELATYDYELRASEARILQATLRPNPEISLDIENPTGTGDYTKGDQMEQTLTLSQLIERGGKRRARVSEAEAGRHLVEWEYQIKRLDVLKGTTLAFIDVMAAQRRIELAEEVLTVSESTVALAELSVSVGKGSAVEAIRAQVAVSTARIDIEQARRGIATARGNLAAQWGAREADFGAVRGNLDQYDSPPSLPILRQRLLENPSLARWAAEREKRQATLAREQTLARQDITLHAGPRMEGKGQDATFVAGFSIPLPISNRNQGHIAEAQANLAKLDQEKGAAEARAFASLNESFQKLTGAQREIEILEKSVIPGAKDAEKQLIEGYSSGRFTQFEVLDARRTLNAARVQQVRALADYQKARAELDALTAQPSFHAGSTTSKSILPQAAQPKRK